MAACDNRDCRLRAHRVEATPRRHVELVVGAGAVLGRIRFGSRRVSTDPFRDVGQRAGVVKLKPEGD